ncbi:MAG: formylmethanofuran dehydrogenase subunit A, partial [Hyphomicrobiaceae bacterium]|nr:formylmethanofuran dehydrogenase subunit A [Hyphomicrobiaceae bacterium]
MLIKLSGAKVYDPANSVNGELRDVYVDGGKIVSPDSGARVDKEYDLKGRVLMAGAIDPHTHIGGGKVTIARTLMPEDHQMDEVAHTELTRAGTGHALPSTMITGYRYAEMGYTAGFEPAVLPANARQAHMELGDTPMIDKGGFVMMGSDDFILRLISEKKDFELIKDYIAWTMHAAQAIAVKIVNPGGISAFKFNQRKLDLDERHPYYDLTPRDIVVTLARALTELGVTHPVHVHGCNLGIPGNVESTLATIRAADGLPLHLTHIQFHSYGTEGDRHFSSGAARIAELLNKNPNVSIDVGQVLFGQTCTASGDSMRLYAGAKHADPKRWVVMDIECDAGCGIVPFRYRDKSFVHALQWAIGLETFLLCEDPW